MPILFALTITIFYVAIHTAFVMYGQAAVDAAAQDAMVVLQQEGTSNADAVAAANRTLDFAPNLVDSEILVNIDGDEVEVYVEATIEGSYLGIEKKVWAIAGGPVERFYNEEERR